MSNKIKGLTITLSEDVSEEYAQRISDSISLINGVVSVDPVISDAAGDYITRSRLVKEIEQKFHAMIWEVR